jgi:hypothetical protein
LCISACDFLSVAHQPQVISFFVSLPVMFYMEGAQWSAFLAQCLASPTLARNVFCSGISFYVYDELATMTVSRDLAVKGFGMKADGIAPLAFEP